MLHETSSRSLQAYARMTGALYVISNATAIFAFSVRGQLVASRNPQQTADNIIASEALFRLGLASELITIVATTALVLGSYVVLRPIDHNLSMLAVLWRVLENAILASLTFASFTALALLQSSAISPEANASELGNIAYALIRVHTYGFQVGFLFLGLGSALFAYLWYRSRYVPRPIALWGIFASLLMAIVAVALIIDPALLSMITLAYMAPMGMYEIGFGLWLMFMGIRLPVNDSGARHPQR